MILPTFTSALCQDEDEIAARAKEKEVSTARSFLNAKMVKELMLPLHVHVWNPIGWMLPGPLRRWLELKLPDSCLVKGSPAAAVRILGLKDSQVRRIRTCFHRMDNRHHGYVSVTEFVHFIHCKDTLFVRTILQHTIFHGFDINQEGKIEFPEFLKMVIVLCTFSYDQIMHRIFVSFDADGSGFLDKDEMLQLGEAVQGIAGASAFSRGNIQALIADLDQDGDGVVSMQEFLQLGVLYPAIFYPAFRLQEVSKPPPPVEFNGCSSRRCQLKSHSAHRRP